MKGKGVLAEKPSDDWKVRDAASVIKRVMEIKADPVLFKKAKAEIRKEANNLNKIVGNTPEGKPKKGDKGGPAKNKVFDMDF